MQCRSINDGLNPLGPRIVELDMARGIGIILVTLGHSQPIREVYPGLWATIYLFHIPLFFFLSGCLSAQSAMVTSVRGYGKFLWRRLKFIIAPYITVSLVFTLTKAFVPGLIKRRIAWDQVVTDILLTPGSNPAAYLWFIYTLIVLIAIAPLLRSVKWPIALPGLLLLNALDLKIPFLGIEFVGKFALYFYLGMLSGSVSEKVFAGLKNPIVPVLATLLFAAILLGCPQPPNVFTRQILAGCGIAAVLGMCFAGKAYLPGSLLGFFGRRSFDIYILQYFFIFPGFYALQSLTVPPESIVTVNFFLGLLGPLVVSMTIFSNSRCLALAFGASNLRLPKQV